MPRPAAGARQTIFLIASDVPHRDHTEPGVTAVHVVVHELLRALLVRGHRIVLQLVFNVYRTRPDLTPSERRELDALRADGVTVLPPVYPAEYRPATGAARRSRLARAARLLIGRVRTEDFYPSLRLRPVMEARVLASGADAVLTVWSPEGVAATAGLRGVPRVAFHGDVDFEPAAARVRDRALFYGTPGGRGLRRRLAAPARAARDAFWLAEFRRAHLRLMDGVDVIANVAACNAERYRRRHPRSIYVRNTWRDARADGAGDGARAPRPIRIVGHVGRLGATGSTYGLRYLLVDLMPVLRAVMDGLDYEVHVIGAGTVVPALAAYTRQDRLVMRGFVEDLDAELRASDVFLLLNNAGALRAAFTRHIVAWSMGLCLVVHARSRLAIPEIRHLDNALVGDTPAELARLVRRAVTDPALNARVRAGGRATYEREFAPAVVARTLSDQIGMLAPGRAGAGRRG